MTPTPTRVSHPNRPEAARSLPRSYRWAIVAGAGVLGLMGAACDRAIPEGNPDGAETTLATDSGAYAPSGGPVRMEGLYVDLGQGRVFSECVSGRAWTVADGPAADRLRADVLVARDGPDTPVYVVVLAHPVDPSRSTDDAPLAIDSTLTLGGDGACPGDDVDAALEGTVWQLVGLPEPDLAVQEQAAWVRLDTESGSIVGHTGCRDLGGRYTWAGTALTFSGIELRGALCLDDFAERRLLEALRVTGTYRLDGESMVLMGEQGPRARFTASPGG